MKQSELATPEAADYEWHNVFIVVQARNDDDV